MDSNERNVNAEKPYGVSDILYYLEQQGVKAKVASVRSILAKMVTDGLLRKASRGMYAKVRPRKASMSDGTYETAEVVDLTTR